MVGSRASFYNPQYNTTLSMHFKQRPCRDSQRRHPRDQVVIKMSLLISQRLGMLSVYTVSHANHTTPSPSSHIPCSAASARPLKSRPQLRQAHHQARHGLRRVIHRCRKRERARHGQRVHIALSAARRIIEAHDEDDVSAISFIRPMHHHLARSSATPTEPLTQAPGSSRGGSCSAPRCTCT